MLHQNHPTLCPSTCSLPFFLHRNHPPPTAKAIPERRSTRHPQRTWSGAVRYTCNVKLREKKNERDFRKTSGAVVHTNCFRRLHVVFWCARGHAERWKFLSSGGVSGVSRRPTCLFSLKPRAALAHPLDSSCVPTEAGVVFVRQVLCRCSRGAYRSQVACSKLSSAMPIVRIRFLSSCFARFLAFVQALSFRVAWLDDKGISRVNRGYRYQYSSALGPFVVSICCSIFSSLLSSSLFRFSSFLSHPFDYIAPFSFLLTRITGGHSK